MVFSTLKAQATATSSLKTFVGEETPLPPPPVIITPTKPAERAETASSSKPKTTNSLTPERPAAREQTPEWTPQQQEELLQALFNADTTYSAQPRLPKPSAQQPKTDSPDDILAQLFSSIGGSADKYLQHVEPASPTARTLGQRLIPILHLLCMISLVIWFAIFKEPEQFRLDVARIGVKGVDVDDNFGWKRWASLAGRKPAEDVWSVPNLVCVLLFF